MGKYQSTRDVIAEYLKMVNKASKQKAWEEGQSLSGLWTWLTEQKDPLTLFDINEEG